MKGLRLRSGRGGTAALVGLAAGAVAIWLGTGAACLLTAVRSLTPAPVPSIPIAAAVTVAPIAAPAALVTAAVIFGRARFSSLAVTSPSRRMIDARQPANTS